MYSYDLYTDPYFFNYAVRSANSYGDDLIMTVRAKLHNTLSINSAPKASQVLSEEFTKKKFDELFPMAVRYCHSSPSGQTFLIERPPFQFNIDYSKNNSNHLRKYDKSIQGKQAWAPWTVMSIFIPKNCTYFGGITFRLYFNNSSLSSLEDVLIPSFFPNSSSSGGNICVGSTLSRINYDQDNPMHIKEIAHTIYNDYFSGGWNADISNVIYFNKAMLPAIKRLEERSEKAYASSNLDVIKHALEDNKDETYHHLSYVSSYVDFFYCYSEMNFEEVFQYFNLLKDKYERMSKEDSFTLREILNTNPNYFSHNSVYYSDPSYLINHSPSTLSYLQSYSQGLSNSFREIDVNITVKNFDSSVHHYYYFISHPQIIKDCFVYLYDSFFNPHKDVYDYDISKPYHAATLHNYQGALNVAHNN